MFDLDVPFYLKLIYCLNKYLNKLTLEILIRFLNFSNMYTFYILNKQV